MDEQKFLARLKELKTSNQLDLSLDEDLSLAIMNLISLEEHFFFTAKKTGDDKYFDQMQAMREIRKTLLKKMITTEVGETWCISKHLLATSMRLMEVGSKYYTAGKKEDAKQMYDLSYQLYALFWELKLGLTNVDQLKTDSDSEIDTGEPWTKQDILKKLVNCCKE